MQELKRRLHNCRKGSPLCLSFQYFSDKNMGGKSGKCEKNMLLHKSANTITLLGVKMSAVQIHVSIFVEFSEIFIYRGGVSSQRRSRLKGPLGRSLRLFARTAHSAHSLRSAPLCYARFARSLRSRARSLTSLTPSWDS